VIDWMRRSPRRRKAHCRRGLDDPHEQEAADVVDDDVEAPERVSARSTALRAVLHLAASAHRVATLSPLLPAATGTT
jgi:hypothetical protein